MKTGTEHNRRIAARKPQDRRAVLLGSTAIPADNAHPDAEILDLGRRRAELIQRIDQPGRSGHDVAPLLIEWKEVDHLIMELQPKTAAGMAVQLSVIWRQFGLEPGEECGPTADSTLDRVWLWTAMKNAERIGGIAQPAHDRQSADSPIFAAFNRWADLVRDCCAAKTDEDCERLSEQADEAALMLMIHEPMTRDGLAAQVYVMFHLEHGGTADDHLDIDFSAMAGGDGADNAAVHALVERVRRIGRPGGGGASQELPTSLYTRWAETRARYLADDLSDEEAEALEDELDRIEDRLESEPVRCMADAVAKLGYFLTASNAMLKNGQMPNLDPRLSSPLDRILAAIEDGAPAMPETMRAPLQALAAGLRQLMQRHVTLAGEAERTVDAYQLPDEVSQAMQAVYARTVAANAEADIRNPGPEEELRNTFRRLEEQDRKSVMALAPFMMVSAHLNDAMLNVAREHGVIRMHRAWLEGHLADIPAEQDGANDQRQDADAFADTVAAFEAEAPTTLALPQEPTGRMVDAGASAAGITPAQFQAAYAAAVEALKLERAA